MKRSKEDSIARIELIRKGTGVVEVRVQKGLEAVLTEPGGHRKAIVRMWPLLEWDGTHWRAPGRERPALTWVFIGCCVVSRQKGSKGETGGPV